MHGGGRGVVGGTGLQSASLLVAALRNPDSVVAIYSAQWSGLLSAARAEVMIGTLAHRVADQPLPSAVRDLLVAARRAAQVDPMVALRSE